MSEGEVILWAHKKKANELHARSLMCCAVASEDCDVMGW